MEQVYRKRGAQHVVCGEHHAGRTQTQIPLSATSGAGEDGGYSGYGGNLVWAVSVQSSRHLR